MTTRHNLYKESVLPQKSNLYNVRTIRWPAQRPQQEDETLNEAFQQSFLAQSIDEIQKGFVEKSKEHLRNTLKGISEFHMHMINSHCPFSKQIEKMNADIQMKEVSRTEYGRSSTRSSKTKKMVEESRKLSFSNFENINNCLSQDGKSKLFSQESRYFPRFRIFNCLQ